MFVLITSLMRAASLTEISVYQYLRLHCVTFSDIGFPVSHRGEILIYYQYNIIIETENFPPF